MLMTSSNRVACLLAYEKQLVMTVRLLYRSTSRARCREGRLRSATARFILQETTELGHVYIVTCVRVSRAPPHLACTSSHAWGAARELKSQDCKPSRAASAEARSVRQPRHPCEHSRSTDPSRHHPCIDVYRNHAG
jgi:hypothetical protein